MISKTDVLNYFGRDFRSFYERYGLRFQDQKPNTRVRCLWHDDQHPSLSINTQDGTFYCHAGCGSGSIFDFYARINGLATHGDFPQIVQGIAADFGIGVRVHGQKPAANTSPEPLLTVQPLGAELRAWLTAHHKIYSEKTLQHFGIGQSVYHGEPCLVIPIREDLQKLYFWQRENKQKRWQHHPSGKGWLYDENDATDEVILCEGEWDFLTLYDRGYRGLATGTTGAASLPKGLAERLKGKEVFIVYDRDEAGRVGAKKAAKQVHEFARSVFMAELPEAVGEHGDVSDYFNRLGRAAADFEEEVLRTAKPYEPESERRDEAVASIPEATDDVKINPAQDFVEGVLHYAVATKKDKAKPRPTLYLLTSQRQIVTVADYEARGLVFTSHAVLRPRISKGMVDRILGGEVGRPAHALYQTISEYIRQYIALPDPRYSHFLALWSMGTYVHKIFRYYPYVWLNSLMKGSGKTLLMEILRPVVFNGLAIVSPSLASLFRYIADGTPTLMIDELEWLGAADKERYGHYMAILNAGFNTSFSVSRSEVSGAGSDKYENSTFSTFCPKMMAGLKELESTLRDRTIRIDMVRQAGETVRRYRVTTEMKSWHQQIRDEQYQFGLTQAGLIDHLYQNAESLPFLKHLHGRELDLWEPILILASLVDQASATADLLPEMIALSLAAWQSKQAEDQFGNETIQLLITWRELMTTLPAAIEEGDTLLYAQDAVLTFFRNTEAFAWMEHARALTVRLQRLRIVTERRRVGPELRRFYKVDRVAFADLCRRLLPP